MVEQVNTSASNEPKETAENLSKTREKAKRAPSTGEPFNHKFGGSSSESNGQRNHGTNKVPQRRQSGGGYYRNYRNDDDYYNGYRQNFGERYYSWNYQQGDGRSRQNYYNGKSHLPPKKNQREGQAPKASVKPVTPADQQTKPAQPNEESESKNVNDSTKDQELRSDEQNHPEYAQTFEEEDQEQNQEKWQDQEQELENYQDGNENQDLFPEDQVGGDLRGSFPVIANEDREPKIDHQLIFGDENELKTFQTSQSNSLQGDSLEEENANQIAEFSYEETEGNSDQTYADLRPYPGSEYHLIRLNVGGRIFDCSARTLLEYPKSKFSAIFSGEHQANPMREFFFDRDPNVFEVIVNFCRTGKLYRNDYISLERVREEAEFFQLDDVMFPDTKKLVKYKKTYSVTLTPEKGFNARIFPHQTLILRSAEGKGVVFVDIRNSNDQEKGKGLAVYNCFLTKFSDKGQHEDPKGKRASKGESPQPKKGFAEPFGGDYVYFFYAAPHGSDSTAEIEAVFEITSTFDSSDLVSD